MSKKRPRLAATASCLMAVCVSIGPWPLASAQAAQTGQVTTNGAFPVPASAPAPEAPPPQAGVPQPATPAPAPAVSAPPPTDAVPSALPQAPSGAVATPAAPQISAPVDEPPTLAPPIPTPTPAVPIRQPSKEEREKQAKEREKQEKEAQKQREKQKEAAEKEKERQEEAQKDKQEKEEDARKDREKQEEEARKDRQKKQEETQKEQKKQEEEARKREQEKAKDKEKEEAKSQKERLKEQARNLKDQKKHVDETASRTAPAKTDAGSWNSVNAPQSAFSNANAPSGPLLLPDPALVSVLRDVAHSLNGCDAVRSEDVTQRAVVALAQKVLAKGLDVSSFGSDRIVHESGPSAPMTTEAWASGELTLSDGEAGSFSAVWAKHENGFFNLSIAGKSSKMAPNGRPIGQFVVVILARANVEKGFDIQSQSNVKYWVCRPASVVVEADCCIDSQVGAHKPTVFPMANAKPQALAVLLPVVTDRSRAYLAKLQMSPQQPIAVFGAVPPMPPLIVKLESHGAVPDNLPLRPMITGLPSVGSPEPAPTVSQFAPKTDWTSGLTDVPIRNSLPGVSPQPAVVTSVEPLAPPTPIASASVTSPVTPPTPMSIASVTSPATPPTPIASDSATPPSSAANSGAEWDKPGHDQVFKAPSAGALLVVPQHAIPGQPVTVSVVNADNVAESSVEVSFDGHSSSTDEFGRVEYMVPEDAVPGSPIEVAMPHRPDLAQATIDIVQPLDVSAQSRGEASVEKVTQTVGSNRIVLVNGHNFDGNGEHDVISIDNIFEAKVLAASPLQLRVLLPDDIKPGQHGLSLNLNDKNTKSVPFYFVDAQVIAETDGTGRDRLIRLYIKVLGSSEKVRLHVVNQTPETVRLIKGDEQQVVTPGNANNAVVVVAQRLRAGNFKVSAKVE